MKSKAHKESLTCLPSKAAADRLAVASSSCTMAAADRLAVASSSFCFCFKCLLPLHVQLVKLFTLYLCFKCLLPLHVQLVKLFTWYLWMCDDLSFIRTRHLLVCNGTHVPFVLHNLFHAFVRAHMFAFQTVIPLASITSAAASAAVFRAAGLYLCLPTCIAVEILVIPFALVAAI